MNLWRKMQRGFRALFRKEELDREMDEEIRSHLEMRTRRNIEAGMNAEEARYAALRNFGGMEQVKEICRELRGASWIENLGKDSRFALRLLRKNLGLTFTIILILALGIGATTVMFSVVNAVLLSPLPYKEPARIVKIWRQQIKGAVRTNMDHKDFKLLRENNQVFEQLAAYCSRRVYVQGIDPPLHIRAEEVSPSLFALLGVQPRLGRVVLPEEEQEGKDRVVILSDAFWKEHFGASTEAVGRPLILDGQSHTVIGVMSPDFRFPYLDRTPFWLPLVLESKSRPFNRACYALARLKPGVTQEQAHNHVGLVAQRLVNIHPANAGVTFTVNRLPDELFGNYRKLLWLLLGAMGFVLLVACSNVANLLLARATARQREMVVRLALGASRGRLIRQMLTESMVLSFTAGLLSLFVTYGALKVLLSLCPAGIPRMAETQVNTTVLLFALTVSMLTGLGFGLVPAWKGSDLHLGLALKGSLIQSPVVRGWWRLRDGFVISQLGVSLILLVGGLLLFRSLLALQAVDLGFQPEHLLRVRIELPEIKYPQYTQRNIFYRQLLERLRSLPGVRAATVGEWSGRGSVQPFSIEGRPPVKVEEKPIALSDKVSPGFFETLGLRILKGRTFTQADLPDDDHIGSSEDVAVIDEKLARDCFAGVEPIGQRIKFDERHTITIVGVVSSLRDFEKLAPAYGHIYQPIRFYYYVEDLVLRTKGDPLRLAGAVRAEVKALDKDQAVSQIDTVEATLSGMLAPRRFSATLIGLAAGIALVLAVMGIYGLLQYSITLRVHEIGVRMALGASSSDVLKGTLKQGLKLVLIGITVGLAGALALSRILASLLYEVRSTDALTLAGASALLALVAVVACWFPARKAAKVNPMVALRYE